MDKTKFWVLDVEPKFHYVGRKFEIISGGQSHNTQVFIDGVEQEYLQEVRLKVEVGGAVQIGLEYLDLGDRKNEALVQGKGSKSGQA